MSAVLLPPLLAPLEPVVPLELLEVPEPLEPVVLPELLVLPEPVVVPDPLLLPELLDPPELELLVALVAPVPALLSALPPPHAVARRPRATMSSPLRASDVLMSC
jgi:hypothetical protein